MKETSRHHLFQKCDGGTWHSDNIVRMRNAQHSALHTLFGIHSTLPIEKINFILRIHKPTLREEVASDIQRVLDLWKDEGKEAYNPNVLKKENVFTR